MSLADFRADGDPGDPWGDIPPLQTTFTGCVLAFDQSLGDTGWVCLYVVTADRILISGAGMIRTKANDRLKVAEDTYQRTRDIESQVETVFSGQGPVDRVVIELPPTGGRNLKQVKASLMAGYAIYRAATERDLLVQIIHPQVAKNRWTGSKSASKAQVREALVAQFPGVAEMKPLNEHTTDAVLLALTAIEG